MAVTSALQAWDAFGNALQLGAMQESWTDDRRALADATRTVIRLFEGHQEDALRARLAVLFKHPRLLGKYRELAHTDNIVAPLIRKVATVRQARVVWDTAKDQALWDEIATTRMGTRPWARWIPFLSVERMLAKNAVVTVGYDSVHDQVELYAHYPHTCDVGWREGNETWDYPDTFTLLNTPTPKEQAWNAATTSYGGQHFDLSAGYVYDVRPDGSVRDARPLPIVDGAPLRPFTPFRTSLVRGRGFWVWDGQRELAGAQTMLNWLWTCEVVTIHYGAFKMPLLKGRWTDDQGRLQELLFDTTEVLVAPHDPLGKSEASVEFVGPDNGQNLESIRASKQDVRRGLASSLHLDGEAFISDNHGSVSGYSLRVKQSALIESHAEMTDAMRPEITALVNLIRTVNDVYRAQKFTTSGQFSIIIPPFRAGETLEEEVRADDLAVKAGFVPRRTVLAKYNPGLTSGELEALESESDEMTTDEVLRAHAQQILTTDEARRLLHVQETVAGDQTDD